MLSDLIEKKLFFEKFSFSDPERFWHFIHHLFPKNSFLVCALDMAGWDLFGKMKRKQLHQLWNLDLDDAPPTDYTIGIDEIPVMIKKLEETEWPFYKIKVGVDNDIEIISALREKTSSPFRVDANGGWTVDQAMSKIPLLKELGVQFVEQPIQKDDWEGMKYLYSRSPLPLVADESCVAEADVLACQHHFHGINIKLTKCAGITPARRMISKARDLGLQVMLGCMNESSVGTAALAQLAPLADYLDCDGPLLLAEDIATGIRFEQGKVICSGEHGLGINMNESFSQI